MGDEAYRALLAKVAQFAGIDEAEFLRTQEMEFKGTPLRFEHVPRLRICRVAMLLEKPPGDPDELLQDMLYSNCSGEDLLPVMALEPLTDAPIMFLHFPLSSDADVGLGLFLSLGMDVFLTQWRLLCQEDPQQSGRVLAALA